MFNRIHSHGRKLLLLLRANDGGWVKNAVVLLGSYAVCALSNKLFHLVLELQAHRPNTTALHSGLSNNRMIGMILLLLASLSPLFEELVFRLSRWWNQVLFTVGMFVTVYLFTEAVNTKHDSTSSWIYVQSALSWAAAIAAYISGSTITLEPTHRAKLRYLGYTAMGVLGLTLLY